MLPLASRRWMGVRSSPWPRSRLGACTWRCGSAVDLVSFGRPEPVSLGLVDDVVHAPGRAVALVFESVGEHQGGDAEGGASPYFLHLLVALDDGAVGGDAVDGAHFALRELHHVKVENLLQCPAL